MAPKNKKKGSGRRSKTSGQTSASNPNPIATSPSVSSLTGDATTISILPSSASQIITTQPLPPPPPPPLPLPVQETQQEFISLTSNGSTTTGLAGPSTAPSASAASTRTRTFPPTMAEFMVHFPLAVACKMTALQRRMRDNAAHHDMLAILFGLQLDKMELALHCLLMLAEVMQTDSELRVKFEGMFSMRGLRSAMELTEVLLAERKKRHGSGGSCGGSKEGGGGPDSGNGDGDGGEGGGVVEDNADHGISISREPVN